MNRTDPPANAFKRGMPGTPARTRAEGAIETLRQRGGVFVDAVRSTRMAMVVTDPTLPGNPIVFANQSFLDLSGYEMDEVLGQKPHFMNGSGTDPKDAARFRQALEEDRDVVVETIQYRKDGSRFVATVLLSAFKDEEGRTLNQFLSWADVTRRVDAEDELAEQRELYAALRESEERARDSESQLHSLLAELQHRVRNTLAVVKSITNRTADSSISVQDMTARLTGRLDAFARVQSAVTRDPAAGIGIAAIVADELVAHAVHEGHQLSIKGPDVGLRPKAAESFSLAIHELATNAVKHGALGHRQGKIAVSWKIDRNGDDGMLQFEWIERGLNGNIVKPARNGFGIELLTRILPYDLGAKTNIEFTSKGIRFSMSMPMENVASAA